MLVTNGVAWNTLLLAFVSAVLAVLAPVAGGRTRGQNQFFSTSWGLVGQTRLECESSALHAPAPHVFRAEHALMQARAESWLLRVCLWHY